MIETMVSSRLRWLAAGIGLAACAACSDGLGPELQGASVRIYMGDAPFDEQTVAVGEVLDLSARVFDSTGEPIPGQGAEVLWRSEQPDVATVDGAGSVETRTLGTAYVIARHSVGEDTARINVAAYVTDPVECLGGDELALTVGETRIFAGEDALSLCLPGAGEGAEYTLVVANTGTTAASTLPVHLRASGTANVTGPPTPSIVPDHFGIRLESDERFHRRIRHEISRNLEPRLRAGVRVSATDQPPAGQLVQDEIVSFNVSTNGGDGCADPRGSMRAGRVRVVTEHAIIVADTLNPAGGFTDEDYQQFAEFFDTQVWPFVTGTFGTPSDIDNNSRAIIFFTLAVNELPQNSSDPENAGSYIGGFFFNRDLFPEATCAGSNVAEMFYMLVPDPAGQVQPGGRRAFPLTFVRQTVPTLLVHEFQHLVNDSRRLLVNQASVWEETWLNEALSHIAEELMFYRQAGLEPRQNLGAEQLSPTAVRAAFKGFQLDNVARLTRFLREPELASLMGEDVLETRGASWLFLRYAADRRAGGESALWHALVRDARQAGLRNLEEALGEPATDWIRDWAVAVYADDTVAEPQDIYGIPSWNLRSIYPMLGTLAGQGVTNEPYPLRAFVLTSNGVRTLPLKGGGAGYARVGVAPDERAAVRVTVGASSNGGQLPPPSRVKVAVIRTK